MDIYQQILIGIVVFTIVILILSFIIIIAGKFLVSTENATIKINNDKNIIVEQGQKLLQALNANQIFLSSACGGKGTCGQCEVELKKGGGSILAVEEPHFSQKQIKSGCRLACQVAVKGDLDIEVPSEVFGIKKWECEVISNHNVATFIKEFCLKLPEGEEVNFKPGGFVQLECPPYDISYKTFDIEEEFREDWDKFKLWGINAVSKETTIRAYSMANYPAEKGMLKFNIRIATPPFGTNYPSGIMSTYVFNMKPGDKMTVFGAFGEFFIKETEKEMVYIGGGAGMAPLRSHIFELLKERNSNRKISYWYGARSLKEVFYEDEFRELEAKYPNFKFNLALSEPLPEDNYKGSVGFIHNVLYENYLKSHKTPEECEYYVCGPPMMLNAIKNTLESLGVEPENIAYDDFG